MPILPPRLDDRSFDDLLDDLLARIPAHTPEWTNPRLGDPGRTLLELFAWLGDALLYRANLIPERQRLVFLKLLGQGLRPAQPARGIVGLAFAQPTELAGATLAAGARIKAPVPFETLSETTVLPVTAEAYYKRPLPEADRLRMAEVLSGLQRVHGIADEVSGYLSTALFEGGQAAGAGVDVFADSVDRALWLALLAPVAAQPERQPAANAAARAALGGGDSGAAALLSVGVVPAIAAPALFEEIGPRARVPVLWEVVTAAANGLDADYLTVEPLPGDAYDTTAGLTRPGVLRLPMPDESLIFAPVNDVGENPRAGVADNPPRIDDAERAARLVGWLRLRPRPGSGVGSLRLSWVGVNAVEVDQRVTIAGRVIGASTGAADQVFQLPAGSVDPASLVLQVEAPGRGYQPWTRVDDLAAISADPAVAREAPAFELDAEAGIVRFGDGVRGRVPERQMRIRLASGRFGGGRAGNLPPGSLAEVSGATLVGAARPMPAIKAWQPLATEGGEDAETLARAEQRIPAQLRHRERAVTAEDYRRLAAETPGTDVGRVEVLPRFKPRERRPDVPGVVSVMVLPARVPGKAPNPRPDRPFIERVHAHLSARTPLATELYVIGCEYVPLGISVAVAIRDGFAREAVLYEVGEALRRLLWPLPPGGQAGAGWPLGRDVRERELEVEVSRVAGVAEVAGLNLFGRATVDGRDRWSLLTRATADGTQTLELAAWQLPELLSVVAVDDAGGTAGAPADLSAVPNPFAGDTAVAVPVVPEVC
ncbi:putative baseplate assembly protein [Thauera sinica]|uniref:Baseplate assembly protein n=1 Tax=Thauera sinica TaxID=2665146 RepID=A0ABW1AKM2_9RHOO|nr:putative baseplate assembly protein [Thauera sp. K11]ATE59878.1 putative baseplate assembly protein [Thauera sp. K11]